jgi:hypothetical protein
MSSVSSAFNRTFSLPAWKLIILGASNSTDIEVLGRVEEGSVWKQLAIAEDSQRAQMPTAEDEDARLIGLTVDITSTENGPTLNADEPPRPPAPILFLLNNTGSLYAYSVLNSQPSASHTFMRPIVDPLPPFDLVPAPQPAPTPDPILAPRSVIASAPLQGPPSNSAGFTTPGSAIVPVAAPSSAEKNLSLRTASDRITPKPGPTPAPNVDTRSLPVPSVDLKPAPQPALPISIVSPPTQPKQPAPVPPRPQIPPPKTTAKGGDISDLQLQFFDQINAFEDVLQELKHLRHESNLVFSRLSSAHAETKALSAPSISALRERTQTLFTESSLLVRQTDDLQAQHKTIFLQSIEGR